MPKANRVQQVLCRGKTAEASQTSKTRLLSWGKGVISKCINQIVLYNQQKCKRSRNQYNNLIWYVKGQRPLSTQSYCTCCTFLCLHFSSHTWSNTRDAQFWKLKALVEIWMEFCSRSGGTMWARMLACNSDSEVAFSWEQLHSQLKLWLFLNYFLLPTVPWNVPDPSLPVFHTCFIGAAGHYKLSHSAWVDATVARLMMIKKLNR